MFFPKFIALAFLASSVNVGAFTITPRTSLGIHHRVGFSTASPTHNNHDHDHSLKFWGGGDDQENDSDAISDMNSDSYGQINNGKNDLIAPSIYAVFTGLLIFIIYGLRDAVVATTLGSKALALVTGALIWDNMIISIGSLFFRDIEVDLNKYKILETLSIPRFTLHAVALPLQCVTVAEMGRAAGVEILQDDLVQMGVIALAVVVAVLDRKKFAESPGITRTTYEDTPFDALERDLVKFGYVEPDFAYVIPAIVLSLFNLVVGIEAMKIGTSPELAKWMVFAGASALVGNALPGSINAFSGNLGEAGMQYGLLNAARIVYGGL